MREGANQRSAGFAGVLEAHAARYPRMEPRDFGKLAFQSEFGPRHLLPEEGTVLQNLREELIQAGGPPKGPESIGNGLCRFHLNGLDPADGAPLLSRLFCMTAGEHTGALEGLLARLELVRGLGVPGLEEWLEDYRRRGCPDLRHSEVFRDSYRPHYRVVRAEYAWFFPALLAVRRLAEGKRPAIVAVDGRCGSGKTGLATLMERLFSCNVIHMDDFYLPMEDRAPGWEHRPGGNMDFTRLQREVLAPARVGEGMTYRGFDCQSGSFLETVTLPPRGLTVLEGSYSHHPSLSAPLALKLFLTCSPQIQSRRLGAREGDYASMFQERWIPLEEAYFRQCGVEADSDMVFDTGDFFPE